MNVYYQIYPEQYCPDDIAGVLTTERWLNKTNKAVWK